MFLSKVMFLNSGFYSLIKVYYMFSSLGFYFRDSISFTIPLKSWLSGPTEGKHF